MRSHWIDPFVRTCFSTCSEDASGSTGAFVLSAAVVCRRILVTALAASAGIRTAGAAGRGPAKAASWPARLGPNRLNQGTAGQLGPRLRSQSVRII